MAFFLINLVLFSSCEERKRGINWNSFEMKKYVYFWYFWRKEENKTQFMHCGNDFFFVPCEWLNHLMQYNWIWVSMNTWIDFKADSGYHRSFFRNTLTSFLSILILWIFFMFIRTWQQEKGRLFLSLHLQSFYLYCASCLFFLCGQSVKLQNQGWNKGAQRAQERRGVLSHMNWIYDMFVWAA